MELHLVKRVIFRHPEGTKGDLGHPSRPEYWRKLRSDGRLLRTMTTLKPDNILPHCNLIFKTSWTCLGKILEISVYYRVAEGVLFVNAQKFVKLTLVAFESCTIRLVENSKLCLIIFILLLASCSGGGSTERQWPPDDPRQPERLVLVAPNETDSLLWWKKNILVGLAENGFQDTRTQLYVEAMLAETNRVRQANGIAPVELLDSLNAVAQAHALDEATRDYWAHQTPEGLSSRQRVKAASGMIVTSGGENSSIGYSGDETAVTMVRSWERHVGHRQLLLDPAVKYMGGGWARYAGKGLLHVTQLLVSFESE